MKAYFYDLIVPHEDELNTCYWRRVALGVIAVVLLGFTAIWTTKAYAEAVFTAEGENGAVITLHKDTCAIKVVSNLPYRATWVEGGKTFEGCWAAWSDSGVVLFYFDDGSVGLIPFQMLRKAVSA